MMRVPFGARLLTLVLAMLASQAAQAASCQLVSYGTLPVTMEGLRPMTTVKVNGKESRFILDSGAFFNFMSQAQAAQLGLSPGPLPFDFTISGIGGSAVPQLARIRTFGFLGTELKNVEFLVGGTDAGAGLIGANLLALADTEYDLAAGKVRIVEAKGCGNGALAYWSSNGNYSVAEMLSTTNERDRRSFVAVTINGKTIRALLDSGASGSLLSRDAAERAGIDLTAKDVLASYGTRGVGRRTYRTWIAPVDQFKIGDEEIRKTHIAVMDGTIGNGPDTPDMLLGTDFMLAHHMLVAKSQRRIYFTYNGGKVFSLGQRGGDAAAEPAPAASASTARQNDSSATPKTAEEFALRGNAHIARHESALGIADLSEAIRQAPDVASYHVDRAKAYLAIRQPKLALDDLDAAVKRDPDNVQTLIMRARVRLGNRDTTGALADAEAAERFVDTGSRMALALANLFVALDAPARAIPLFDGWVRLHGDDAGLAEGLNDRCWSRALANVDLDKALDDCNRALRIRKADAGFLDSRGMVYLRRGDYPHSIADYDAVLARQPGSAWSLLGRGLARLRAGQEDAGKADLAAAKTIEPDIESRAIKLGLSKP